MRRFQDGEIGAFDDLYSHQGALVYRVALRYLDDWALAEDLTQTVFFKILSRPSAFHGGSFDSWISRVTRNAAIDHTRKNARVVYVERLPDVEDDARLLDLVVARLDVKRLHHHLADLTETNRSLIELSFFMGQSHEEISVITGLPLGTVKTRIRAGLKWLRGALLEPKLS